MSRSAHTTSRSQSSDSTSLCNSMTRDQDTVLFDRHYRVTRAIEQATHGQRFSAYHVELAIPVTITVLRPLVAQAEDDHLAQKQGLSNPLFWKLALQAASLRHPVLPRVRDSFLRNDAYVVVIDDPSHNTGESGEWPARNDAETLACRLEGNGRLSIREALVVGLHLCDALAYVEQVAPSLLPLTTITPQNLLVRHPNAIMLQALRPSRWLDGAHCSFDAMEIPYLAPELVAVESGGACSSPDVRADLYGVAAVMYSMLAGEPPVQGAPAGRRVPLREIEPLIPTTLSDAIECGLQADPGERFADANAFGHALATALAELLPGLVARINAPYSGPPDGAGVAGERVDRAAALSASDPADNAVSMDSRMPATMPWSRGHADVARHTKGRKRSPFASISAALGLSQ